MNKAVLTEIAVTVAKRTAAIRASKLRSEADRSMLSVNCRVVERCAGADEAAEELACWR